MLVLAEEEAWRLNHNFVGTEHLFQGIAVRGEGDWNASSETQAKVRRLGVDLPPAPE